MKNFCIETTTATTKKVEKGRIRWEQHGGSCFGRPYGKDGVYLNIADQTFPKPDLKHLIDMLSEIHEALEDTKVRVTKTNCNCVQCKEFEKDVR